MTRSARHDPAILGRCPGEGVATGPFLDFRRARRARRENLSARSDVRRVGSARTGRATIPDRAGACRFRDEASMRIALASPDTPRVMADIARFNDGRLSSRSQRTTMRRVVPSASRVLCYSEIRTVRHLRMMHQWGILRRTLAPHLRPAGRAQHAAQARAGRSQVAFEAASRNGKILGPPHVGLFCLIRPLIEARTRVIDSSQVLDGPIV